MTEAAAAMRAFADTISRSIETSANGLAKAFAAAHGSHVKAIEWGEHDNGDSSIYVILADGHRLTGRGEGKLDALVAAESTFWTS